MYWCLPPTPAPSKALFDPMANARAALGIYRQRGYCGA
jgi:hypothetical protein